MGQVGAVQPPLPGCDHACRGQAWRLHVAEALWNDEAQPEKLQQLVPHTVEHHSGPALLPLSAYHTCGGKSEADTWPKVSEARGAQSQPLMMWGGEKGGPR
jgi:hypothetical protein